MDTECWCCVYYYLVCAGIDLEQCMVFICGIDLHRVVVCTSRELTF
jgi:hypothetical protein